MLDIPLEPNSQPSYDPSMETRVARLESDMREVKAVLARLEPMIVRMDATLAATLPHLATKAELADLRSELRADLAAVPTKTYMWGILGVLVTAYAAGLAALAVIR